MIAPLLVYLTLPSSSEHILNIQHDGQFIQYQLTKDQLYNLNADIADALIRGRLSRQPLSSQEPLL